MFQRLDELQTGSLYILTGQAGAGKSHLAASARRGGTLWVLDTEGAAQNLQGKPGMHRRIQVVQTISLRALMQAIPSGNPRQRRASVPLAGEAPSPTASLPGCAFASRCPHAIDACRQAVPALEPVAAAAADTQPHVAACIRRDEIGALAVAAG